MHKTIFHTMIRQTNKLTCVLVCLLFLAGCGGGGDTSSHSTGGLSFKLQFIDSSESKVQLVNAEVDICDAYGIDQITADLSRMDGTAGPLPLGVLRCVQRPTYEEQLLDQEIAALVEHGPGDLAEALAAGETWDVA